jgi:TetR/AcrR family transcriptional regulator, mexJK operon transcriptional repressor
MRAMAAVACGRKIPRGQRRRLELVDVAGQVFLERGFAETTMLMIAERAGASKETLYRHFASKKLLFAEIVSRKALEINGRDAGIVRGGSPESVLSELGLSLLQVILTEDATGLFRMVVTEAVRNPQLGDLFYQRGPGITVNRLVAYLTRASMRGELCCENPRYAARLFLGAVASHYHLRCLIQAQRKPPTESEIKRHVAAAVKMFLARYRSS